MQVIRRRNPLIHAIVTRLPGYGSIVAALWAAEAREEAVERHRDALVELYTARERQSRHKHSEAAKRGARDAARRQRLNDPLIRAAGKA